MNSFGRNFRIQIFGESHGLAVGILVDGCPPGIALGVEDFEADLARRRSGATNTTPRREADVPKVLSGFYKGRSTGSPISLVFENSDTRSSDYDTFQAMPRPGHADLVSRIKYGGFADPRGSGHFSGRVTVGLVAAGTIAKKILSPALFSTRLVKAGGRTDIADAVAEAAAAGDSLGALVEVRVRGLPAGLGEPFFDACESLIAQIVFAVPGIRGVEFGDGFNAAEMRGSEHNDPIIDAKGRTGRNGAGGMNGGISNGNELVLRAAVKPASSISLPQRTFNFSTKTMGDLMVEGRHDACIGLRSAVVIESATAIALADLMLTAGIDAHGASGFTGRNS
ncbi:MAG: chorismate synthase [Spirochaetes bacterium]|nr:chorismate synthase [Spirochaetota bacterium]